MVISYCLQTYYEHTCDSRVIELMRKLFKIQFTVPDNSFLVDHWQHMRGGNNLYIVHRPDAILQASQHAALGDTDRDHTQAQAFRRRVVHRLSAERPARQIQGLPREPVPPAGCFVNNEVWAPAVMATTAGCVRRRSALMA